MIHKHLGDLLKPWDVPVQNDLKNILIHGISCDSRKAKAGDLFLVLTNNENFILEAEKKGVVAFLFDSTTMPKTSLPCIFFPSLNENVGEIASAFYNHPSDSFVVTGVTGTNGKTTVAYLLAQAFESLCQTSRYVGTLGVGPIEQIKETGMTTPDALDLQTYCYQFSQEKIQQLAMEVSSHGLDQNRLSGMKVDYAVYTNLTHDHLDYHGSFEEYAKAKAKLFSRPELKAIAVNGDCQWHNHMLKNILTNLKVIRFGLNHTNDVFVRKTNWTLNGMHLEISSPWGYVELHSKLLGHFNVYNLLAVFSILMLQGFELEKVIAAIKKLKPVPGRMEVVSKKPLVIVDYAHTPDALENVLNTLRQFQKETQAGELWAVFGCGGDRDSKKRPIMGKIASELADFVVVTSDNPRFEAPEEIIRQILKDISPSRRVMQIEDRKLAIISTLEEASDEDIILIAGKGHETYQQIGETKEYFSDQDIVKEYIAVNKEQE